MTSECRRTCTDSKMDDEVHVVHLYTFILSSPLRRDSSHYCHAAILRAPASAGGVRREWELEAISSFEGPSLNRNQARLATAFIGSTT